MYALDKLPLPAKTWGQGTLFLLGLGIIMLAGISYLTNLPLSAILAWAKVVFGWSFTLIFLGLTISGVVAIQKLAHPEQRAYWYEVGQQAANGVSTLALTFTLLGISLGIGSLSEQTLSPENIQDIIAQLTKQFSTAFMTTVVGLPCAAVLRAWLGIRYQALATPQSINELETHL